MRWRHFCLWSSENRLNSEHVNCPKPVIDFISINVNLTFIRQENDKLFDEQRKSEKKSIVDTHLCSDQLSICSSCSLRRGTLLQHIAVREQFHSTWKKIWNSPPVNDDLCSLNWSEQTLQSNIWKYEKFLSLLCQLTLLICFSLSWKADSPRRKSVPRSDKAIFLSSKDDPYRDHRQQIQIFFQLQLLINWLKIIAVHWSQSSTLFVFFISSNDKLKYSPCLLRWTYRKSRKKIFTRQISLFVDHTEKSARYHNPNEKFKEHLSEIIGPMFSFLSDDLLAELSIGHLCWQLTNHDRRKINLLLCSAVFLPTLKTSFMVNSGKHLLQVSQCLCSRHASSNCKYQWH